MSHRNSTRHLNKASNQDNLTEHIQCNFTVTIATCFKTADVRELADFLYYAVVAIFFTWWLWHSAYILKKLTNDFHDFIQCVFITFSS